MQLELDDKGGARELAFYRMNTAREDLEAARFNYWNLKRISSMGRQ